MSIRVPTDFPTIQAAIDSLASYTPPRGDVVEIIIESGHKPIAGVFVEDGDYSFIRITSEDAIVDLDESSFPWTPALGTYPDDYESHPPGPAFICGARAAMPVLATVVDLKHKAHYGYAAAFGSRGQVALGGGAINGRVANLFAYHQSEIQALRGGAITGCLIDGAKAFYNSSIHAYGMDASGCGAHGFFASRGSRINARTSKANNCGTGMMADESSIIDASESDALNCSGAGYAAERGSTLSIFGCDASGSVVGVRARSASRVSAPNIIANDCGAYGIIAEDGGFIDAPNCTVLRAGDKGAQASRGGWVRTENGTVKLSGVKDLAVFRGGQMVVLNTQTTNGTPALSNTNVTAFNAISGSNGIIWN